MVIAIDFDGTIVDHEFPNIGKLKPNVCEIIQKIKNDGHEIVIWTCRDHEYLSEMIKFLLNLRIPFDAVNNNAHSITFLTSEKIYYDILIDDRQLGGIPNDWNEIYKKLMQDSRYIKLT